MSQEKIFKKPSNIEVVGIFPKKEEERKRSYISIVYIKFNKTGDGLLVFFDDELTTFRNKNESFICHVKKNKKALWIVKTILVLYV